MNIDVDVAILGAGPGGYVAAIRAAQLGLKTQLIEKDKLGGVCLNWGCIPTKALLKSAQLIEDLDHANNHGITISNYTINTNDMFARSRNIASQLSQGIKGLMSKNKIGVTFGTGRLQGPNTIIVTTDALSPHTSKSGAILCENTQKETIITAKYIIIATGARSRLLPTTILTQQSLPELTSSHPRIWAAHQAMLPPFVPKSLLILGSGAIGVEFASFYRAIGTAVTIIEMQPQILPMEDKEISEMAKKIFMKKGIEILTSTTAKTVTPYDNHVEVVISDDHGKTLTKKVDAVLVAIGIEANTENLGLETTKIQLDKSGHIITNNHCQTDDASIFSIGDVTKGPWLAHKASHEALLAVETIGATIDHRCPMPHAINYNTIPNCTYSLPQIASFGLNEEKAKALGHDLRVGRFLFKANGKAQALGETDGMVKIIFDKKTGEILGAHLIGSEVTEMIHSLVMAKQAELTEQETMNTIFPHPTLSEMIHEATLDAFGRVIHF